MKKIAAIIAGAALATGVYGENVPVPKNFSFTMPYVPGGRTTSWTLDGNQAKLVKKGTKHVCMFMKNVEAPAYLTYDPYDGTPKWECPRVTVRHLRDITMVRAGGKCRGFVCKYDYVFPGDQAAITTDEVEYCPDILLTTAKGGDIQIVGAKFYDMGDNYGRYFSDGVPIDISYDVSHLTEPKFFGECATDRYRKQLRFYDGPDANREHTVNVIRETDTGWDGR